MFLTHLKIAFRQLKKHSVITGINIPGLGLGLTAGLFAYRADLPWWSFALPTVPIFLIAGLTVSVKSLRAAPANPVEALRDE